MKSVHIIISGRVQGVAFRASAVVAANRYNIKGTVRNVDDSVEIYAQGEDKDVDSFVKWCRQGPALARIDSVSIENVKPGKFKDFSII